MEELTQDIKGALKIFIADIMDYTVLLQKLISYLIVVLILKNFVAFDILQEIKTTYWLLVSLGSLGLLVIIFFALKKKWTAFLSGALKEFSQIAFTGLGILFMGMLISGHFKWDLLSLVLILAIITKFYLALFKYFEKL